jgi:hypothetical protein
MRNRRPALFRGRHFLSEIISKLRATGNGVDLPLQCGRLFLVPVERRVERLGRACVGFRSTRPA